MTEKTYNGWTNYETWNVALWIDNDQGTYEYWREQTQEAYDIAEASSYCTRKEKAAQAMAQQLRDQIEDEMPDLGASMWSDLLSAALSEVNWDEIAGNWMEEVEEEETEEVAE